MTLALDQPARSVNLQRLNGDCERWTRLATTLAAHQPWYRLTLPYRIGLLGHSRSVLEVEFFDRSGEQSFEAKDRASQPLWQRAYSEAQFMAFCLPLWVALPGDDITSGDWRAHSLDSFHDVVQNYRDMRRQLGLSDRSVRSILALTTAYDRRSALKTLRERSIAGYLQHHRSVPERIRRSRGIARYIANARRVSEILTNQRAAADSPSVVRIPAELSFDGNPSWLIPVSAIYGEAPDQIEADFANPDGRPRRAPPEPIHVELPLIVALYEQGNALM